MRLTALIGGCVVYCLMKTSVAHAAPKPSAVGGEDELKQRLSRLKALQLAAST